MENAFYEDLFSHFMAVAWREAPALARDEGACREVFHDRVLFPPRVKSREEAIDRLKGAGREFRSKQAYKNFLYTVFKNAIIDHLRDGQRRERRSGELTDAAAQETFLESTGYVAEELKVQAAKIFGGLTREERRVISLRYLEKKTLIEVGKALKLSKSTVDRREKAIERRLFGTLSPHSEYSEDDVALILSILLDMIAEEDPFDD